jgi:phage FluMu protein Com
MIRLVKHFNLLEWLTRRRDNLTPKIEIEMRCTACKRNFSRKVRRLYIDLNIFEQRQAQNKALQRSEFIVPERIACPKCKAVDQFKLAPSTYHLLSTTTLIASSEVAQPHRPVQCIRFTLLDGRAIHPLDALELYRQQLAQQPDQIDLRREYANTLRMLGYHVEAEAQYRAVLAQDPNEPNALLNLAIFHDRRLDKETAAKYLFHLIASVEQSQHPDHNLLAEAAQQILDGVIKMEQIELTAPALFEAAG